MEALLPALLAAIAAITASSGFWAWLTSRNRKKHAVDDLTKALEQLSCMTELIKALAYDKLVDRGMLYIANGSISRDEFEDFEKMFYKPYKALGGNGLAEKIMNDLRSLQLRGPDRYTHIDPPINQKMLENTHGRPRYPDR